MFFIISRVVYIILKLKNKHHRGEIRPVKGLDWYLSRCQIQQTDPPRIGRSYGFPPTTCARKQLYVGHGHGSQHSLNAFRGKVQKKNPMVGTREKFGKVLV